jgi:hypothetical protein
VAVQTSEPGQFVVELGTRLGISVRKIQAADQQAVDRSFDVAGLCIPRIAGERGSCKDRLCASRKNGDTVPGRLSVPDRMITHARKFRLGECGIGGFQLLQTNNVRPGFL